MCCHSVSRVPAHRCSSHFVLPGRTSSLAQKTDPNFGMHRMPVYYLVGHGLIINYSTPLGQLKSGPVIMQASEALPGWRRLMRQSAGWEKVLCSHLALEWGGSCNLDDSPRLGWHLPSFLGRIPWHSQVSEILAADKNGKLCSQMIQIQGLYRKSRKAGMLPYFYSRK